MSVINIDREHQNNDENSKIDAQFAKVGANGFVSKKDVIFLRRDIFSDGVLSREELSKLLSLGERAPDGDPEWVDFFGEAAADFYLREEVPHDYITERDFIDLKGEVTRYAPTVTPLVLSMLIKLLSKATATPPDFQKFVSEQIKRNILDRSDDPVISKNDVNQVRNFLYAMGSDENIAISQKEAEFLFDLNDGTICTQNDLGWSELFVKAVAHHLMGHIGYIAPSREEALRQWHWVNDQSINISGFFKRMIAGGLSSMRQLYQEDSSNDDKLNEDDENALQASEANVFDRVAQTRGKNKPSRAYLEADEIEWLADRIGRDGILDSNERALVEYMRTVEDNLPEPLQKLIVPA